MKFNTTTALSGICRHKGTTTMCTSALDTIFLISLFVKNNFSGGLTFPGSTDGERSLDNCGCWSVYLIQ
jgi:hypothetical protein